MGSKLDKKRLVVNAMNALYEPFGIRGREESDILWHNISWSEEKQKGFFLVRFEPGSSSKPHEHLGMEEFVVLDGELEDCDGRTYRTGDCVSLSPGSRHYSHSKNGCTLAVFLRGGLRSVEEHAV